MISNIVLKKGFSNPASSFAGVSSSKDVLPRRIG